MAFLMKKQTHKRSVIFIYQKKKLCKRVFQTVDKVRHRRAGFFCFIEPKVLDFKDFEALFWYNKSIKKGGG